MVMTNAGFDGTVDEAQYARTWNIGGADGVDSVTSWLVTQGSGRQVSVAAQNGWAFAAGVVSRETVALTASIPTPTQGAWYVVVRRVDWSAGTATSGVSVAAVFASTTASTTAPTSPPTTLPTLNTSPGTLYDQPLAWVFVNSVNTTLTIFDLRKLPLGSRVQALELVPPVQVELGNTAISLSTGSFTPAGPSLDISAPAGTRLLCGFSASAIASSGDAFLGCLVTSQDNSVTYYQPTVNNSPSAGGINSYVGVSHQVVVVAGNLPIRLRIANFLTAGSGNMRRGNMFIAPISRVL